MRVSPTRRPGATRSPTFPSIFSIESADDPAAIAFFEIIRLITQPRRGLGHMQTGQHRRSPAGNEVTI